MVGPDSAFFGVFKNKKNFVNEVFFKQALQQLRWLLLTFKKVIYFFYKRSKLSKKWSNLVFNSNNNIKNKWKNFTKKIPKKIQ